MKEWLKRVIPNGVRPVRILGGPFRGAVLQLNPKTSLRKVFGLYERELNSWLESTLPRVETVLDVGANEGYFTLGCAAAFRRLGKTGEVIAFEPNEQVFAQLRLSVESRPIQGVRVTLYPYSLGAETKDEMVTLDSIVGVRPSGLRPEKTLVKMDVEGAELDVIAGASSWLNPTNHFLIEVHEESFLERLTNTFLARGLKLRQINQRRLPVLGYENRSRRNWWLVSDFA